MKKLCVLFFCISLLGLSFYGLFRNIHYIEILMNLSQPYMFIRIALVFTLATYVFVPGVRLYFTKALLGIGGLGLLALGLITLGSPTFLGKLDSYILIGDALTFIEGGILAVILSAELPARKTHFMANGYYYVESLFATRTRNPTYTSLSNYGRYNQNTLLIDNMLDENNGVSISEGLSGVYAIPGKVTR